MPTDVHAKRKELTFAQAEGVDELPRQLRRDEISPELRAMLWLLIHTDLQQGKYFSRFDNNFHLSAKWEKLLHRKHIFVDHKMVDEFISDPSVLISKVKKIINSGDYVEVYGFLQWVLRENKEAIDIEKVKLILKRTHAAYRLIEDPPTFIPISSEEEVGAINQAFLDLRAQEFDGARTHLRTAAQNLTSGGYADSIRESIHAVESVARLLGGTNSLGGALQKLKSKKAVHPALEKGFGALYGFTSDEKGIRHPLLDDATSAVDETDAIFMIGACASFVSYLINRTRDTK
ncbi:MAG: hypothetical protein SFW65_00240 [Alphaproteobacteria bacterium]|nr:hypothetical protein [Alphaproteobacteria bacterium]